MNTLVICRKRGWKRRSRSNNASAFLSFFAISIASLLIICSISTAYFSVPVWAANPIQCLVWELITTLTVASGSAPVSAAVNQAGMASPLGTYTVAELAAGDVSVAQCDAAIQALTSSSNAASQAAGGIAQSFATTAADAAQAAEALSAAGVEGVQAAEGAMSAGENLANCAAASVGAGSIVGMLGMEFTGAAALGAGAVAVVAGVGLGVLGHNIVSHFAKNIKTGLELETQQNILNKIPDGANVAYVGLKGTPYDGCNYYYTTGENNICAVGSPQSEASIYVVQPNTNSTIPKHIKPSGSEENYSSSSTISGTNFRRYGNGSFNFGQNGAYYGGFRWFSNIEDLNNHYRNIYNNNNTLENQNQSPDLVNPNGNYTYNPVTNNYNYNYTTNPTYNTNNQTLQPIYNTDYQQFINNTNYNTTNNIDNSQTFQDFISNYLTEYTAPAPDTDPDIPEQPIKPTVTPNTSEQIEQNKEMMLPVDLKDYFPFCIPFDIYTLMTHFEDIDREAPEIDIDLDLGAAGEYTINVDLSDYDDAASLLRALELIAFIIGLMIAARKLIGD